MYHDGHLQRYTFAIPVSLPLKNRGDGIKRKREKGEHYPRNHLFAGRKTLDMVCNKPTRDQRRNIILFSAGISGRLYATRQKYLQEIADIRILIICAMHKSKQYRASSVCHLMDSG